MSYEPVIPEPIKVGDTVYLDPHVADKLPDGTKVSRTYTVKAVNKRVITLDDDSKWSVGRDGLTGSSFKAFGRVESYTAPYIRRGQPHLKAITPAEFRRIWEEHNHEADLAKRQGYRELIRVAGLTGAILTTLQQPSKTGWQRGELRGLREANPLPEEWDIAVEDALLTLASKLGDIRQTLGSISERLINLTER